MKAALTMDMLATDLADYLVRKGVSCDVLGFMIFKLQYLMISIFYILVHVLRPDGSFRYFIGASSF